MGKYNEAKKYYQRFLNQHEYEYQSKAQCYHLLGNKALKILIDTYGEDDLQVAICFNNMGIIYDDKKKYDYALKCYEKTLIIRLKHLPNGHCDIDDTYNNIGAKSMKNHFFSQHPSIASTGKNMGITYEIQKNQNQALEFYKKAANIFQQTLPINHPDIIEIDRLIRQVSSQINT